MITPPREALPVLLEAIEYFCTDLSETIQEFNGDRRKLNEIVAAFRTGTSHYVAYIETWEDKLDTPTELIQFERLSQFIREAKMLMNQALRLISTVH